MVDILYKLEVEMSKVDDEIKATIDTKWSNCLEELDTIRDVTWHDIDIDITIWEMVTDIKAFQTGDSD